MDELSETGAAPDGATAVIFDFDGLMVDTETPGFESWRAVYRRYGVELTRRRWVRAIGVYDHFDPASELVEQAAGEVDPRVARAARQALHSQLVDDQPLRAGVAAWVAEAREAGHRLGVASSSTTGWVRRHLERLELDEAFEAVVGRDEVGDVGKPDPDVYVEVLRRLQAAPGRAVAIEDSGPGLASARAAGLATIAVPNQLTRDDVSEDAADLYLDSLEQMTLAEALRALGWDGV